MSDLQIVTTPILLLPSPETRGESTALVPADRGTSAGLTIAGRDTSSTGDRYVWSAVSDGSGVYHFQYRPESRTQDSGSATISGNYSVGGFTTWQEQSIRNAISQYLLHAAMPSPSLAQSMNVYC